MNHEDRNWRRVHMEVARQAVGYIAASKRHVMGQQVLTLGLSGAKGFVHINSKLFISATKAQALHQPFRDGRSIAAIRYRIAQS